jgi:hypothetical protein
MVYERSSAWSASAAETDAALLHAQVHEGAEVGHLGLELRCGEIEGCLSGLLAFLGRLFGPGNRTSRS